VDEVDGQEPEQAQEPVLSPPPVFGSSMDLTLEVIEEEEDRLFSDSLTRVRL